MLCTACCCAAAANALLCCCRAVLPLPPLCCAVAAKGPAQRSVSIHNLRTVAPRYGDLLALLVYLTWLLHVEPGFEVAGNGYLGLNLYVAQFPILPPNNREGGR